MLVDASGPLPAPVHLPPHGALVQVQRAVGTGEAVRARAMAGGGAQATVAATARAQR